MIEYQVGDVTFNTFDAAAGRAVRLAASGRKDVTIDVLIYSKEDAKAYGGEYAMERYLEDPDASVSERITIKAESLGRIA